jgi:hypothetical protein
MRMTQGVAISRLADAANLFLETKLVSTGLGTNLQTEHAQSDRGENP